MLKVVAKEELADHIGKPSKPSDWFEIDQSRINKFADATLDHQFIHVNATKAAATPFGTTIAHGFLTLSLLPYLNARAGVMPKGVKMGINYGLNKLRFLTPVKTGSKVRSIVTLKAVDEKAPGQILMTNEVVVEIEGEDKPALVAETLVLYFV